MRLGIFLVAIVSGCLSILALGCPGDQCLGLALCGDECADLSTSTSHCGACGHACDPGQACVDGGCLQVGCTDECPAAGVLSCSAPPENGIVVCADFQDGDACLEWGGFNPCSGGEACVEGACTGGCDDECGSEHQLLCEGNGFRECGRFDTDSCLEWSSLFECAPEETCSRGVCSGECDDECADGEVSCRGDGLRSCGQFDDDGCLDWSPVEPCGEEESCDDGACVPRQCTEEGEDCVCGDDECCEGHCCPVLFVCVSFSPDEDYCPFGEGPNG